MLTRTILLAFCLGLSGPAIGEEEKITVPSGQDITFQDFVHDAPGVEGLTYRFRFVAPAIAREGGTITQEQALGDMQALCDTFALARISNIGPAPSQIIISLSDRAVPFGEPSPDATQFFEAYQPENDKCIWEGY